VPSPLSTNVPVVAAWSLPGLRDRRAGREPADSSRGYGAINIESIDSKNVLPRNELRNRESRSAPQALQGCRLIGELEFHHRRARRSEVW